MVSRPLEMLIAIFAYAFSKFIWSSWQYNALSILVGSAAAHAEDPKQCPAFINCSSDMAAFAGDNFNKGMRAYYLSKAESVTAPPGPVIDSSTTKGAENGEDQDGDQAGGIGGHDLEDDRRV